MTRRRRLLISLAAYLGIVAALPVALAANDRPADAARRRSSPPTTRRAAAPIPVATPVRSRRHIGCGSAATTRRHGPAGRRLVALTFDDGPSPYTPRVLRVLRGFRATATFFEVGQLTAGHGALMRRIVGSGSEIGNHSMHHDADPSSPDLAATSRRIRAASGFEPCLFRPPYGVIDPPLVRRARRLGMQSIKWDVDPDDWERPGTRRIFRRVTGAVRPGSIVMLHDGGGDRGQTVAALPRILTDLRRRGYRSVSVTRLLRHRWHRR